ncbi:MAG: GAF domain-containing sensor histidine kinase [Chloroflexota bacterium]
MTNILQLTREQLEERLLALHRASLQLVQEISLETLLERIASLACEQAGARYAAVGVVGADGELQSFIPVGMSEQELARMAHPPRGLGLIGALMHAQEPIRVADITTDPRSVGFPPNHPAMSSFLGIPIRHAGRHIGQIYLTDKVGAPEFTADDQLLIEMLAAYAAVAISNARMYQQLIQRDRILTRRNENLALLNELASTLATSADIEQILDKALTQVLDYLQIEVGEIYLRLENSRQLKLVIHRGRQASALWARDQYTLGEGIIGQVAKVNQPRLISIKEAGGSGMHRDVLLGEFHQVACLPINGRQGVIGVLCVATCHPRPLDEMEVQFLATIGSWVGTAIENVRLNLQGRRLAVLEERERIGMDLHDGIIQSIYAVGLTLEHARLLVKEDPPGMLQRIEQAISDLNSTIRDIRAYILDLRPRQLHNENLMQGIRRLVQEFRANTLLTVNLQGADDEMANLLDTQSVALFHICQEALANIAKHARARSVTITLWSAADRALMEITDDGRGFEPERMQLTIGHGLSNMHTRARNVGGDVEISSEPGGGTTILAWVPLQNED